MLVSLDGLSLVVEVGDCSMRLAVFEDAFVVEGLDSLVVQDLLNSVELTAL